MKELKNLTEAAFYKIWGDAFITFYSFYVWARKSMVRCKCICQQM